ncbi:probable E3 ubiquitin-protein ligase HERC3 [Chanos chanos]|uniref:Probable E3 ubiquitin-protein ligase HERC3 n=1 Tax=Chanos chanos TaxID=29144 RepID=A0A6J2WIE9_CHACN|nr:probable E3 ubiquitin-protein ligase HERC3 [Chanos chanos]
MYYWGADAREGFGFVPPGTLQPTDAGIRFLNSRSKIQDVAVGKKIVGFIHGDGKVSVIRSEGDGLAQAGKRKPLDSKKDKIKSIHCGENHVVLLAHGDKVLFVDMSSPPFHPSPLSDLSDRKVTQVACGDQHSMALTNDGQLFTWGQNSSGQLGLGKDEPSTQSPKLLSSLSGIPLVQISAGGDHSFALSLSGAVFGWGKNNAGQLGLGDNTDRNAPANVSSLNFKKTIFISCGEEHTVTLTEGGLVFTFGSGRYGQLGHNSFGDELHPRLVAELLGSKVSQVACGRRHTLVFVESSRTMYSFGCGEQGRLGNGQTTNQCIPLPVHLSPELNQDQGSLRILAGGDTSIALYTPLGSEGDMNNALHSKALLTLDKDMIDRWVSGEDSKSWKVTKREIKHIFSSAACLNGSFLKKSCDEHYRTSEECSGLDLPSVRLGFEKLAESNKVLSEVEKVVELMLVPSLNPSPAGVEALRVYLILPELLRVLRKHQLGTDLTVALASAILSLDPEWLKVLERFWSKLSDSSFKTLVKMFRRVSAKCLTQIVSGNFAQDGGLQKTVQVLQRIYKVGCNTHQKEKISRWFHIHEVNFLFEVLQTLLDDLERQLVWSPHITAMQTSKQLYENTIWRLMSSPCIFDLEAKCALLKNHFQNRGGFPMILRRTALLEDSFDQLRHANEHLLKGVLMVQYVDDMKRSDVNKRDFFLNLFDELLKPSSEMFMYNDNRALIWFPPTPRRQEEDYFLFGILCGLAFYNNSVVHLPFPLALFKKLLDVKPSLEDFKEFSPDVGKSLQYLLDYADDDAENMYMSFTVVWDGADVELDLSEPGRVVTSANKTEFVNSYVDYALNKSVERVFEEFKRGFFKVCDREFVEVFLPEELMGLILGKEDYDWETFKKNVQYEDGYHAGDQTITMFWEVFEELSHEEKKKFLLFLTGYDRVPILGMKQIKMRVRFRINFTQEHLPEALTCHSILDLPRYQSKETLRTKLKEALEHKRGFWE